MSTDARWPEGHDLIELTATDSTNAEAARRAASLHRPTWIRADRQTAGRGRAGRGWVSEAGNLFATLVCRPGGSAREAGLRSFVAANALFDTLAEYVGARDLALKWPNDVLLRGGKIAGILLESETRGAGVNWLAVGIGVNLASAPPRDGQAGFLPVALPSPVAPKDFLTALAANYAREEAEFTARGFARIRDRWLTRAARLGERITARTREETVTGTFETVDADGALRLRTPDGLRAIHAADVFFG